MITLTLTLTCTLTLELTLTLTYGIIGILVSTADTWPVDLPGVDVPHIVATLEVRGVPIVV